MKNSVQDPKCPGFSKAQKQSISDKVHEYFDFPLVLKKILIGVTAPSTGSWQEVVGEGQRDVQIADYRVLTETAKVEGQICNEKAVSELSVWDWVLLSKF